MCYKVALSIRTVAKVSDQENVANSRTGTGEGFEKSSETAKDHRGWRRLLFWARQNVSAGSKNDSCCMGADKVY